MFEFDPHSHELHDDPYPVYRKLREEHPVLWNPTHRFWSVARYDDVMEGLKRPLAFSSDRSRLESGRNPVQSMPMMITMDPPGHDELRALVNRAFTPRRMALLEERIRGIATELIDAFIDNGGCDLWADFAAPLPTSVIASLLGVPPEDGEMFKEKSTAVVAASGPVGGPKSNAIVDLATYLGQVFEEKRKRPADDLMSELLVAEIDGRRLDTGELLGFAILLLIAGNETTTNLISNGALQLDRHPDQHRRLVADPGLVPTAVEECLRFDPPVQGFERFMSEDVELGGQMIREGDTVFLLLASANRDEQHIHEPDRFDVGRTPNRHLSFGWGTHFCLGASLARLEAKVAWEEILRRLPNFHINGPVERLHSDIIRGLLAVPLEFEAAA